MPISVNIIPEPKHIMLIPDGHRRWARLNGVSYDCAYDIASSNGLTFVEAFLRCGHVRTFTFYLIGEHTLYRSHGELNPIFNALDKFLERIVSMDLTDCVVEVIGDTCGLPDKTRKLANVLVHATNKKQNKIKKLNILLGYSGTRNLKLARKNINIQMLDGVDCVIRYGGNPRLSDAPILETLGGALLVSNALFPDVSCTDIETSFYGNEHICQSAYRISPAI